MRLILIVLIGTILGIIWGLYFQNIALIYLLVLSALVGAKVLALKKNKNARIGTLISTSTMTVLHRMTKYIKVFFKPHYIVIFIISIIISNVYFNLRNAIYEKTYDLLQNVTYVVGKVISKRRGKRIYVAIYGRTKANWLK